MGAYNKYDGEHCSHNEILLNNILKKEWGFDGVVVSDWGATHDTKEAIKNGLDIEMGSYTDGLSANSIHGYNTFYLADPYLKALRNGEADITTLNDKARRILRLIFRTSMNRQRPWGSFATDEHAQAARKIGEEGVVLLKNNNILPLDVSKIKSAAVIGENAVRPLCVGGWSASLKVKYEISPLEGLRKIFGGKSNVVYSQGYSSKVPTGVSPEKYCDSLRLEAAKIASKSDVVFFFGGLNKDELQDCEGNDRLSYALPYGQDILIDELQKLNKKVIVILLSGNAVEMPFADKVPAILQAWYLGSEAGNTIAEILTGKVNPSGKLPFSFPYKLSDAGAYQFGKMAYPGDSINVEYKEDILVGYRWFDTKKIKSRYPFGYGLSYTTFNYGKPTVSQRLYTKGDVVKLTFNLTNSGDVAGAEVVQLYVGDKKSSVLRPVKELKTFDKIYLKPSETKEVTLQVPVSDFAFYSEKDKQWIVEPGEFELYLCASSTDIKYKMKIDVK